MRFEKIAPASVTELCCPRRRPDDVREEHGRENAIGLPQRADAREELLDLLQDLVRVSDERKVVLARKLDEPRSTDPLREIARALDGKRPVLGAMHDESGYGDRLEHRPDVDLRVDPCQSQGSGRTGAERR